MKTLLLAGTLATLALAGARADTSIAWSQLSGGGGQGISASVHLSGSIGAFAHAPANSVSVQLQPGFWGGVSAGAFFEQPFLQIELAGGSGVRLSWPVTATGFTLERATVLAPPDWQDAEVRPSQADGRNVVIQPAQGTRFYRLVKP